MHFTYCGSFLNSYTAKLTPTLLDGLKIKYITKTIVNGGPENQDFFGP
jgi:hypothetical protein